MLTDKDGRHVRVPPSPIQSRPGTPRRASCLVASVFPTVVGLAEPETESDYLNARGPTVQARRRAKTAAARAKPISPGTARRELEDLRAAINEYHAEHMLIAVPTVILPPKGEGRSDWLTRTQAARLLGVALGFVWDEAAGTWKRENGRLVRRDRVTRTRRRHAARFLLIGLYSARREATIRRTQWTATTTAPWFDLDRMIYHGRGREERRTDKRRPPAKIADRLRPHLLRWRRLDQQLGEELGIVVRHVVHTPDGRPLAGKNQDRVGRHARRRRPRRGVRPPHDAPHRRDLADAGRHRSVEGRGLARDEP